MRRKDRPKPRSALGKAWHFIWEDDSLLSWVVNIILAIVLIKFVVYPGLGLLLGTQFPIVAVVSDSMEHKDFAKTQRLPFDEWWQARGEFYEEKNISYEDFQKFPYKKGFNMGDLMVLRGTSPSKIKTGDILVFRGWQQEPIIHRVVEVKIADGKYFFQTKGDNNPDSIRASQSCPICDETSITEDMLVGRAVLRIPYLGWVKIAAVSMFLAIVNAFR